MNNVTSSQKLARFFKQIDVANKVIASDLQCAESTISNKFKGERSSFSLEELKILCVKYQIDLNTVLDDRFKEVQLLSEQPPFHIQLNQINGHFEDNQFCLNAVNEKIVNVLYVKLNIFDTVNLHPLMLFRAILLKLDRKNIQNGDVEKLFIDILWTLHASDKNKQIVQEKFKNLDASDCYYIIENKEFFLKFIATKVTKWDLFFSDKFDIVYSKFVKLNENFLLKVA